MFFFGGKGGVGKTSCASAYAISRSRGGARVLLVSTDPAHSTRDLFQCRGKREYERLEENLYLIEIDPQTESKKYLETIMENSKKVISPIILNEIKNQIKATSISPGTHESSLFEKMGEIILEKTEYDYIVFDTAPTGHTLRLMKLPHLLREWTETLIKKRRKILRLKEMKTFTKGLMEKDKVLHILEERKQKFIALESVFKDREMCIFNFVLNPEQLALKETMRALKDLDNTGIKVENLIVNKCLPQNLDRVFWKKKLEEQEGVFDILEEKKTVYQVKKCYLKPNLSPLECIDEMSEELKVI